MIFSKNVTNTALDSLNDDGMISIIGNTVYVGNEAVATIAGADDTYVPPKRRQEIDEKGGREA